MLGLKRFLLLFSFELLYHQLAWSYDLVSWVVSKGQWARWRRAALPRLVGIRVLEIGPGPGHLLAEMAGAGYKPCGLELSSQMVRLAQRNLHKCRSAVPLIRGRAEVLPFADGVFDTVVLTFPAAYVFAAAAQREMARVLIPAGRIVVVDGAAVRPRGLYGRILNWGNRALGDPGNYAEGLFQSFGGFSTRMELDADEISVARVFVLEKKGPGG